MRLLTYHLSQRENGIGSFLCFLVIVFDFHIDNMHRSIQFLPTAQQILYMCEFFFHCQTNQDCVRTLANAVEAALFTCDNDI